MPAIPPFVLKRLYVKGSLQAEQGGFSVSLSNVIAPGTITGITGLLVDGGSVDLAGVGLMLPDAVARPASTITRASPLQFPVGSTVKVIVHGEELDPGPHRLAIQVIVREVGPIEIPIQDTLD
jgi:hypothetical protein